MKFHTHFYSSKITNIRQISDDFPSSDSVQQMLTCYSLFLKWKVFNLAWCRKDECTVAEHLSPRGPPPLVKPSSVLLWAAEDPWSCLHSERMRPCLASPLSCFIISRLPEQKALTVQLERVNCALTWESHFCLSDWSLQQAKKKGQKISVEKRADLSVFLSSKLSCVSLFLSFPSVKANERERDSLERKHCKSLSEFIAFWQGTASHFIVT